MRTLDVAGKGSLALMDGVLRLSWKAGETIGVTEIMAAQEAIATLAQGSSHPLLISVQGVTFSSHARRISPSPAVISRIALLGSSPVDQVLALFLLRLYQKACPIRYFTSSRKALIWLRTEPNPSAKHQKREPRTFKPR